MSRDARVDLDWADGTYSFRLGFGQLVELQEKCDAGPYAILKRLNGGTWRIEDVSNVIRLGLIGGGMKAAEALKLVRLHVEAYPIMENLSFACAILAAGLLGAPDDPVGEQGAENPAESVSTTSPMEN